MTADGLMLMRNRMEVFLFEESHQRSTVRRCGNRNAFHFSVQLLPAPKSREETTRSNHNHPPLRRLSVFSILYPLNRYLAFPFRKLLFCYPNQRKQRKEKEKNESKLRSVLILSSRPAISHRTRDSIILCSAQCFRLTIKRTLGLPPKCEMKRKTVKTIFCE